MVDIAKIEKLMILMTKHGFDVVQAEASGEKVSLAKNAHQANFFQPQAGFSLSQNSTYSQNSASSTKNIDLENREENPLGAPAESPIPSPTQGKNLPSGETLTSPFVGTFYRSPGPDSPPFVELGSKVKKGQPLCIVEAMKLMNEIESEVEGEIVAILVDNAKPVEFGTPLFIIAPLK